ncbi:hypothetical protein ACLOJK_016173 [Asimina triloba]
MSIAASSSRISAFQPIDFRPRRRSWTPRTSTPSTIVSCAAASAWNGIKGSGVVNFYELLSLDSQNVGLEEIKRAYRSKAREWHPDVCPPSRKEESTRLFVELQRAYQTLSDPVSRSKYDRELSGLKLNHDHDEMGRGGIGALERGVGRSAGSAQAQVRPPDETEDGIVEQ